MADSINAKRIFLKLERVNENEVKLEFDLNVMTKEMSISWA